MDDATKELCYSVKLAVIKAIVQMPNEEVLKFIEKSLKKVIKGGKNGTGTDPERKAHK